jgi:hypothetical protein
MREKLYEKRGSGPPLSHQLQYDAEAWHMAAREGLNIQSAAAPRRKYCCRQYYVVSRAIVLHGKIAVCMQKLHAMVGANCGHLADISPIVARNGTALYLLAFSAVLKRKLSRLEGNLQCARS